MMLRCYQIGNFPSTKKAPRHFPQRNIRLQSKTILQHTMLLKMCYWMPQGEPCPGRKAGAVAGWWKDRCNASSVDIDNAAKPLVLVLSRVDRLRNVIRNRAAQSTAMSQKKTKSSTATSHKKAKSHKFWFCAKNSNFVQQSNQIFKQQDFIFSHAKCKPVIEIVEHIIVHTRRHVWQQNKVRISNSTY